MPTSAASPMRTAKFHLRSHSAPVRSAGWRACMTSSFFEIQLPRKSWLPLTKQTGMSAA